MSRKFRVYGGFELERDEVKTTFWDRVEGRTKLKLRVACGCYVFAIKHGNSLRPWYVGKAEKTDFNAECFSDRNRQIHDRLHRKNGTLLIFLLPALTENENFRRIPRIKGDEYISHLEEMLMSMALRANEELFNVQRVAWLRNIMIPGFINPGQGKPPTDAQDLKRVLGLS